MKKALSLLLALTLIFAMAAPASAAYTGRFSRDGTYNNVAYLISAVCNTRDCRASITYADPNSTVRLRLTVLAATDDSYLIYDSGNKYCTAQESVSGREIESISVSYYILGSNIAYAEVDPS